MVGRPVGEYFLTTLNNMLTLCGRPGRSREINLIFEKLVRFEDLYKGEINHQVKGSVPVLF